MKVRLKNLYINPWKISDYLLNVNHPDGGPKAKLLMRLGFDIDAFAAIEGVIIKHTFSNDVSKVIITAFVEKYLVEGQLKRFRQTFTGTHGMA